MIAYNPGWVIWGDADRSWQCVAPPAASFEFCWPASTTRYDPWSRPWADTAGAYSLSWADNDDYWFSQ